jgi:hypothetical protein
MAQQTAVEYLLEKLYTEYRFSFSGTIVDQAKAMEKEQIIKAACYEPFLGDFPRKEGEHYYNKIYTK